MSKYPEALERYFQKKGMNPTSLSAEMGKSQNWLANLFSQSQGHLLPYLKLAAYGNTSLLKMAKDIEGQRVSVYLDSLKKQIAKKDEDKEVKISNVRLAKEVGVSTSLIQSLYQEPGSLNGIKSYVELARHIKCEVEELQVNQATERVSV